MSPYTGEAPIEIGGEVLTLVYDWAALGAVRSNMGAEGQQLALSGDVDMLAELVAIGLRRKHPDWDIDRVRDASPPLYPTMQAVDKALVYAYYGPGGAPEETMANPQSRTAILWSKLLPLLTGLVSRRPSSGD